MMYEGDRADGQVDEEDPVPAEVVRQPAAQQRADDGGDAEDGAEEALVAAPLTGREEVADDGQRDGEDGARADALDAPEEDEALHRPREGRQERAQQEDADTEEQHEPAAVDVRELAVEDTRDGGRQQVAGDDPGVELVGPTQLAHDARQGHAHDGLVQGGQEGHQQDADQDLDLALAGGAAGPDRARRGWLQGRGIPRDEISFGDPRRCRVGRWCAASLAGDRGVRPTVRLRRPTVCMPLRQGPARPSSGSRTPGRSGRPGVLGRVWSGRQASTRGVRRRSTSPRASWPCRPRGGRHRR